MAKRFTDSDKWVKKPWFRSLKPSQKLFWLYLLDVCDQCGVWEIDFGLAELLIGEKLDEANIREVFKKQYVEICNGRKWFIQDFIDFQYGELKETNRMHSFVLKLLQKQGVSTPLNQVTEGAKVKDKEEVKDKEKDKEDFENVPRETNSDPLDPQNILASDLFSDMTQFQKRTLSEQYPRDFLVNRLSSYISSAARRQVNRMNPGTVFDWLERDYRDRLKPRFEQPKTKLEKSREALRDFAETESKNVCQRDGDFSGVVPVPRLSGPQESADDLRPA